MPELPEVETVVRSLRPHLVGRTLAGVPAADRRILRAGRRLLAALPGRTIEAVERIGKFVRIVFSPFSRDPKGSASRGAGKEFAVPNRGKSDPASQPDPLVLTIHLGMAGRLLVVPRGSPCPKHAYFRIALVALHRLTCELGGTGSLPASVPTGRQAARATRRIRCEGLPGTTGAASSEIRFLNPRWCMGGVWLHSPGERNDPTAGLGPDPLKISVADFAALLSRRRQIKALLLDQTVLAGMGNIYCDEALFAARIHPRAIASALSRPRRHKLWLAMRDRLAEAIRRGGSSIRDYRDANGQLGWFQLTLAAYGRTGEPCPVCATPIAHCTAAGRSTHFCPRCQRR